MDYMLEAIKEAEKAFVKGEIPVGAVIVDNGKIIARGHNLKEKRNSVISHAEIIAIEKACKKKKTWYLNECEMYVTLEPCMMCVGAITQSHINKVYFSTYSPKYGYTKKISTTKTIFENNYQHEKAERLLKNFFEDMR